MMMLPATSPKVSVGPTVKIMVEIKQQQTQTKISVEFNSNGLALLFTGEEDWLMQYLKKVEFLKGSFAFISNSTEGRTIGIRFNESANLAEDIKDALNSYYYQLDTRRNGNTAASEFVERCEEILGMQWIQGATLKSK